MMKNKNIIYVVLSTFLAFTALTSCIDDDLPLCDSDVPEEIRNGYSLSFIVTLDKMGGDNVTRATAPAKPAVKRLEDMENYIDPEKFRVLFFASDDGGTETENIDAFLFESKGRWVKKLDNDDDDHSSWFVSVPMFDYGNDVEYNWKWDKIREYITTHKFKIAILANRPDLEWNMGILKKGADGKDMSPDNPNNFLTPQGWFNNSGPHWRQNNTIWGSNTKKIFDLHHCQYDPIYDGKNWDTAYPDYKYKDVYDFISEKVTPNDDDDKDDPNHDKHVGRPKMGATSTWVSWKNNDTDKSSINNFRYWIHPDEEHPIPMYGIQEFEPIPVDDWKQGTIFNINDKAVSLLRSVVKLELILPKSINPNYVVIFYPNIYARCEPMDIWTPTNNIWTNDILHQGQNCEWFDIIKYGVVTDGSENTNNPANDNEIKININQYQTKMSWFYGYWKDKTDWSFGSLGRNNVRAYNFNRATAYPRIFNTCVQRNTAVACENNVIVDYGDDNLHYVVYCGERNINDPSNLYRMGQNGSGNPTIIYWMIGVGENDQNGTSYDLPLIDYIGISDNDLSDLITPNTDGKDVAKNWYKAPPSNSTMNRYERYVQGNIPGYPDVEKKFDFPSGRNYPKPWPLLRNHVYRIIIDGIATRAAGDGGLSIKSENLYSKTINFDKPRKEKKETEKK